MIFKGAPSVTDVMDNRDYRWPFWPLLPIYPYGRRRTICRDVVPENIWVFEQIQGIFYVVTPIRMTVIKLREGGLFVYAPIAPTPECMRLLRSLEERYGEVKYIILPTASGLEHKVFVGPFARRCPNAQVYVAPSQWSFPLNLPGSWVGFPRGRTHRLPEHPKDAPFGNEFDYVSLTPVNLNLGDFQETAMLHRDTKTLLVADCLVSIPEEPPEVVQVEPLPLLFHAKDQSSDELIDSPDHRRRGWQRITLFSFYFQAAALNVRGFWQTLRDAKSAPDRSAKNYFGLYPFDWQSHWQQSFHQLSGGGRLLVAPILQTLILNRQPDDVLAWVNQIAQWEIETIIPCHLEAPIAATGEHVKQAFSFLQLTDEPALPSEDLAFMQGLDQKLQWARITPPAQGPIGDKR